MIHHFMLVECHKKCKHLNEIGDCEAGLITLDENGVCQTCLDMDSYPEMDKTTGHIEERIEALTDMLEAKESGLLKILSEMRRKDG